jgi:U4/U6.U5 tri-snRNP component SNU23
MQKKVFVDNIGRRTWDISAYDEEAKCKNDERKQKEDASSSVQARGLLQQRSKNLNFTKDVGKVMLVAGDKKPGFFCDVCDCNLMNSAAYLTHINGRKHQKKLGMSMYVERVDVGQVSQKLETEAILAKQRANGGGAKKETIAEKIARLEREAAEKKKSKYKKKSASGAAAAVASTHAEDDDEEDDDGDNSYAKRPRIHLTEEEQQRQLKLAEARAYARAESNGFAEHAPYVAVTGDGQQIEVVAGDDDAWDEDEEEESEDEGLAARLAALKGGSSGGAGAGPVVSAPAEPQVAVEESAGVAEEDADAAAMMAMMGMQGFGGNKRKR